ncbi:MAG: putative RNA uridine N3 methyltransferase [Candidatus Nitrosotenuis sp.]
MQSSENRNSQSQTRRPFLNISVAIPDSCLQDESTKLDKSRKISILARACAIFGVQTIFIYDEGPGNTSDRFLLATILRYLETPQYLRKTIFPKMDDLRYAGVMHPLQTPHHSLSSNPKNLKPGDIREGAIVFYKGKKFIDIGIHQMLPYFGKEWDKKRVTIQIKTIDPITFKEVQEHEIKQYWGYKVKERPSLVSILDDWKGLIILTSRKGKEITQKQLQEYGHTDKPILIVFGAPDRGLYDILGKKINQIPNAKSFNFFPNQATDTVRMEESLLGILSILNMARSS